MMREYIEADNKHYITKEMSDYELMQFIQSVEKDSLIKAPAHMKEEILLKSRKPVVALEVETKKVSKKVQLLLYGLKVSAVAAAALTLLVFSSFPMDSVVEKLPKTEETKREWNITENLYKGSNKVTSILGNVADKMVPDYDGRGEKK